MFWPIITTIILMAHKLDKSLFLLEGTSFIYTMKHIEKRMKIITHIKTYNNKKVTEMVSKQ